MRLCAYKTKATVWWHFRCGRLGIGGPPFGGTDFARRRARACLDEARAEGRERSLAGSTGLEPAASGVTGRRSNQLNYDPETSGDLLMWEVAMSSSISRGRDVCRDVRSRRLAPSPKQVAANCKEHLQHRHITSKHDIATSPLPNITSPHPTSPHRDMFWWAIQDSNL